jgi:hypothetical protein
MELFLLISIIIILLVIVFLIITNKPMNYAQDFINLQNQQSLTQNSI